MVDLVGLVIYVCVYDLFCDFVMLCVVFVVGFGCFLFVVLIYIGCYFVGTCCLFYVVCLFAGFVACVIVLFAIVGLDKGCFALC